MALQYCFANGEVCLQCCHPRAAGLASYSPLEVSVMAPQGSVQSPACTGTKVYCELPMERAGGSLDELEKELG